MNQSYVIFSGDCYIKLVENQAITDKILVNFDRKTWYIKWTELPELIGAIDNQTTGTYVLEFHSLGELFENWTKCYDLYLIAAGGLVTNLKNQLLLIYRNGKWDLPKGKVEQGESVEQAAAREVCEETGLKMASIREDFGQTYHTYKLPSGKSVFKETRWFKMNANDDVLIPQTEEGITEVTWADKHQVEAALTNTYGNIKILLDRYQL